MQEITISTVIIVGRASPGVNAATIQMFSRLSGVLSGCPPSPSCILRRHFPLFRFRDPDLGGAKLLYLTGS